MPPDMESEIVFRSSVKKALLLLLLSVGFVVLGAWLTTEKPLIGWLSIAFFGLGIPASLLMMRPNSTYLKLDADGIDIVSMSRHFKLKWSEVYAFRMASVRGTRMIAIDYSAEYTKQKAARAVASALSGMEGAIADHYTVPLEQVLKTLNDWKTRHGRAAGIVGRGRGEPARERLEVQVETTLSPDGRRH